MSRAPTAIPIAIPIANDTRDASRDVSRMRISTHRGDVIRESLRSAELRPIRSVAAFLVSPALYRWLPPLGAFVLERVERQVPAAWRCRQYWQTVVGQDLPVTIQGASR